MKRLLKIFLNNDIGLVPSETPPPADEDLPICTDPPSCEETVKTIIAAIKINKAAVRDCAITAEALQGGGDQMIDTIYAFCSEVYITLSTTPMITNIIIPLPKKGDFSLMTNYRRGTSLI